MTWVADSYRRDERQAAATTEIPADGDAASPLNDRPVWESGYSRESSPRSGRRADDAGRGDAESDREAPGDSDECPPLEPGAAIRPGYAVVALLRRGDDLDVYDLWSEERGCRVVGKTLRPDRAARGSASRRLRAEGRLLLSLSHPHLVRAYELAVGPPPLLVLETLPGETLSHLLAERGRLSAVEAAHLGLHLCSAVGYLHRRGVLHLDLKPSNVIASCGIAKVLDLSVARQPGRVAAGIGTPGYMAPEQLRGGDVGSATDVWAIGALLHEALSGQPAIAVEDDADGQPVQLPGAPSPLRASRRLPRSLRDAVARCLADDPAARPTVDELSEVLAGVFG